MKVYLENEDKKFDLKYNYENETPLFEVEKAEIYDLYKFNGSYYSVCQIRQEDYAQEDYAVVRDMSNFNPEGEVREFEYGVTCPYCGYEDSDSYESCNEHDCGRCGSIFAFDRIVTVEYSSQPVEATKVIEVEN